MFLVRIDEKESVRGILKSENGESIIEIQVLDDNKLNIELGQKVRIIIDEIPCEGIVKEITEQDIGITNKYLIQYIINITLNDYFIEYNKCYDLILYTMKKMMLISYIKNNG